MTEDPTQPPIDGAQFKSQLLEMRDQALGVAEQVESAAQPVALDQNSVGRLSRMDAMQGQAMAQASAQRQAGLLQAVQRALRSIAVGDYGRCLECDQWIAAARLNADPTATHCIACAA